MNPEPVSVVVPIYNVESYLEECVRSVLGQTYQNIELILVDDGSTDSSGDICDHFAAEHQDIIVIHQKNGGLSAARNAGLHAATGKYVYFLDSDDYITEDAISHLAAAAEHYEADVVFFDAGVINEAGVPQNDTSYRHKQSYAVPMNGAERMLELFENKEFFTCVPFFFIRRSALGSLEFQDGLLHEDVLFAFQLFLSAGTTVHLPLELYQRRVRDNSIMTVAVKPKNVTSLISIQHTLCGISAAALSDAGKAALDKQLGILYMALADMYLSLSASDRRAVKADYLRALLALENSGMPNKRLYCLLKHYAFRCFPKELVSFIVAKCRAVRERRYWRGYVAGLSLGEKNIFVIGTPIHGNLGDHLIALGEQSLLSSRLAEYTYIDVPMQAYLYGRRQLIKKARAGDLVLVSGGGWLGSLWIEIEKTVRNIVRDFPRNKVVILPQTAYYQNSEEGRRALEETRAVYHGHKDLYLCLRDRASYDFAVSHELMRDAGRCVYAPDMALAHQGRRQPATARCKALLCFRRDREKLCSDRDEQDIREYLWNMGLDTADTTTVYLHGVGLSEREKAVEDKLREYGSARLVVTDRLHSMVFAALAGTPCIALDNVTGKVRGVHEWIKQLDYIRIAETKADVFRIADEFIKAPDTEHRYAFDGAAYSELIDILGGKING